MDIPGTPNADFAKLPGMVGASFSYSSADAVLERARRVLDSLGDKLTRALAESARGPAEAGAALESKVGAYLNQQLERPEQIYEELRDFLLNNLAGGMAPATAVLQDMAAKGVMPTGRGETTYDTGKVRTAAVPGAGKPGAFVQTGDAAKGLSHGALTPQENELGVDPDIEGASITITGQPSDASGQGQGCPTGSDRFNAMQQAAFAENQALPALSGPDVCAIFIWVNDQCQVMGTWASTAVTASPSPNLLLQTLVNQAQAVQIMQAAAQAGGTSYVDPGPCHPATTGTGSTPAPIPSTPPTGPTGPIGSPPPPPPPPCCPEINIPPCPPTPSIPDCVHIDFCDWDKLCTTLQQCISGAVQSGDCALDNDTAYTYKDCDGDFGQSLQSWFGNNMAGAAAAVTVDDYVSAGLAPYGQLGDTAFNLNNGLTTGFPEEPA